MQNLSESGDAHERRKLLDSPMDTPKARTPGSALRRKHGLIHPRSTGKLVLFYVSTVFSL